MGEWLVKAKEEAKAAANYFEDEIIEDIIDRGGKTKKTQISDYSEDYVSEMGDSYYNLREAADLLDDLGRYEADDEGLWSGQPPRDAISIMAGETFRNAVQTMFQELMGDINESMDTPDIIWDFDEWLEEVSQKKGVLDWTPGEEPNEELREGAEKIYSERLKSAVKDAVRASIDRW